MGSKFGIMKDGALFRVQYSLKLIRPAGDDQWEYMYITKMGDLLQTNFPSLEINAYLSLSRDFTTWVHIISDDKRKL